MDLFMPQSFLPVNPQPDWLTSITPDRMLYHLLPLRDLLSGSLYYPSSGFDGDPIAYLCGNQHSFVYVDYGVDRDGLFAALERPGFLGYRVLCHRPVLSEELTTQNWPKIIPKERSRKPLKGWMRRFFCEWVIMERDGGYPDHHGPARFSLLFLCAEGVTAFQALYVDNEVAPSTVGIIQPGTGFGGNWTDFADPNAPLANIVLGNSAGWPDFLLHGGAGGPHWYTRPCWPQYTEKLGFLGNTSIGIWRRAESRCIR